MKKSDIRETAWEEIIACLGEEEAQEFKKDFDQIADLTDLYLFDEALKISEKKQGGDICFYFLIKNMQETVFSARLYYARCYLEGIGCDFSRENREYAYAILNARFEELRDRAKKDNLQALSEVAYCFKNGVLTAFLNKSDINNMDIDVEHGEWFASRLKDTQPEYKECRF